MSNKSSEKTMLDYLENKYGKEFVVDQFIGSSVLSSQYGSDKVIVHVKDNENIVFEAGQINNKNGGYYDDYILSKLGNDLFVDFETIISNKVNNKYDYYYNTLLFSYNIPENTDLDMKVYDYIAKNKENIKVELVMAIKTDGSPNLQEYKQSIYELYNILSGLETESFQVCIGLVDKNNSDNLEAYIRTYKVNNVLWSNLDEKVYGVININENDTIESVEDIQNYYYPVEGK